MEDIAAVIVTRGNVDLSPILETYPSSWEVMWSQPFQEREFAEDDYRLHNRPEFSSDYLEMTLLAESALAHLETRTRLFKPHLEA